MKNAVRCLNCFVTIESKHTHDFKYCDCKHVFVDGGPEYRRRGWDGAPNWMEILDDGTERHCLEMMEPPGPTHPVYPFEKDEHTLSIYERGRQAAFAECIETVREFQGGRCKAPISAETAGRILESLASRSGNDGTAFLRDVTRQAVTDALWRERVKIAEMFEGRARALRAVGSDEALREAVLCEVDAKAIRSGV